ncbi:MAG: FYDLN acid domain-containing protein [Holosporales bacterium]|jgi:uncharacterized protein (TIGR02300 family)|nr:FYDLN acid domain-containing protein [Holosporales bacterium]
MKIEWGKKVSCPACSLAFYDLWKTALVCPYCGNTFDVADLISKKAHAINLEPEDDIDDKAIGLSGFEFESEVENSDIQDDRVEDDIDSLGLVDIE